MKNELLLLEDVDGIGRSGDIVSVKPGFARNFLLPQKKALIAEKHLVRLREKLKEDRAKKAEDDKKESHAISKKLEGQILKTQVKVDAEGHMYGSVTAQDVATLFKEQLDMDFDRRSILIPKGIRKMGLHEVNLKLKEGVVAKISLEITPEEKA